MLRCPWPDPDRLRLLIRRLRVTRDRGPAFMAAGEAIAMAVLTRGGEGDPSGASQHPDSLPGWAEALADAMVGSLLLTVDETVDTATLGERVRLSAAAAVLSAVRPTAERACDAAVDTWMGWGVEPPDPGAADDTLVGWSLLCLLRRNGSGSMAALRALRSDDGVGLILQDWTLSVIKEAPLSREASSFHHLRTHMGHFESRPTHLLIGALVVQVAAGLRRSGVFRWLEAISTELSVDGTTRCTPIPALHRF